MNEPSIDTVRVRQLDLAFDELAGRAVPPPDRSAAILQRLGQRAQPWWRTKATLAAAALMLLGIGVTVAIALEHSRPPATDGRFLAAPVATAGSSHEPVAPAAPRAVANAQPPAQQAAPAHPQGTAAEDLKVKRSAEAMLAAERRLATMRAEGKLPGGREPLAFATLRDWTYTNGLAGMPQAVQALDGTQVVMVGFMLPTETVEDMREFLLVESRWSCCYGTPPDIHGIVRCVMQGGETADYSYEPMLISGTLTIGATIEDGYVVDIFQLRVDAILPL